MGKGSYHSLQARFCFLHAAGSEADGGALSANSLLLLSFRGSIAWFIFSCGCYCGLCVGGY